MLTLATGARFTEDPGPGRIITAEGEVWKLNAFGVALARAIEEGGGADEATAKMVVRRPDANAVEFRREVDVVLNVLVRAGVVTRT